MRQDGAVSWESRIVDTAVDLATNGGFEAVRMRDVAAQSGCALATLYRYFPAKDDLLLAALTREARALERRMRRRAPGGQTALERVTDHFAAATRALFRKPMLAREIVRAATSDATLWHRLRALDGLAGDLVIAALRGEPEATLRHATPAELGVCQVLYQVWFAALVGAVSGRHGPTEIARRVRNAAELVLRGAGIDD